MSDVKQNMEALKVLREKRSSISSKIKKAIAGEVVQHAEVSTLKDEEKNLRHMISKLEAKLRSNIIA